ncbi:MAG: portal protein, partial [Candidatus Heimdallarchaeaceae archaeon]
MKGTSALKKLLIGKDSTASDNVDKIIDKLSVDSLNKDALNYANLVKSYLTKTILDNSKQFIDNISPEFFTSLENQNRLQRYQNADEICDNITYASAALHVISDEIVSPDDITKQSIQILEPKSKESKPQEQSDHEHIINIDKVLNIDEMVSDMVTNTLKYGDYFIEICDIGTKEVPITQTLLTEGEINEADVRAFENMEFKIETAVESRNGNKAFETVEKLVKLDVEFVFDDYTDLSEIDKEKGNRKRAQENRKRESPVDLSNISLIHHDPAYVIKIQSTRFRTCLGYLVLPELTFGTGTARLGGSRFGGTSDNSSNFSSNNPLFYNVPGARVQLTGIEQLYVKLMDITKKHIHRSDISVNRKEIISMLERVVKETEDTKNGKLQIRYVPPDRMQHIAINTTRFFPYGESIFYKQFFVAKLLILQEVAVAIKRMSDSVEKRAIYIETGLPRNTRNLITQIKESIKKRKISLDTFGSISSIPSMITAYEDIIIPQTKGKRFVEIETIEPTVHPRDATD